MKILMSVTVKKADGSWSPARNVLVTGADEVACRNAAFAAAEAAEGEGSITQNHQTLGIVDLEAAAS